MAFVETRGRRIPRKPADLEKPALRGKQVKVQPDEKPTKVRIPKSSKATTASPTTASFDSVSNGPKRFKKSKRMIINPLELPKHCTVGLPDEDWPFIDECEASIVISAEDVIRLDNELNEVYGLPAIPTAQYYSSVKGSQVWLSDADIMGLISDYPTNAEIMEMNTEQLLGILHKHIAPLTHGN